MTLHTFQDGSRFQATSADILARQGIHLTTGFDFEEYRSLLAAARPEHILGAPLDPQIHDMTAENAFWIIGRDATGRIMHTQAMRMMDLGPRDLGDYLRRRFRDYPPSGVDLDLKRSRYRAGPGAQRMKGRIAYHGEFWMGGEPGEYRGSGLSCVLGRYAFLVALQMWDPDYVFGFMQKAVAFKGFAERHGYMHTEPGALRWFIKHHETPIEGFLVYMGREDLRYILDMPLNDLVALAA
ncbi:hypothetical protein [Sulfitobacter sabulilitoris]|uniref:GNAT family N-acetyltransferase n=1 Tax=Sulfitobacter sabulilitoris TaxID=2562655 RepID=A0A5S3PI18_9RHOB|nr:hypothetical protein [Sulfitobacter sabulilitoris]TMM52991.1 hypothetical protein FDT80_12170 [Sulfitobacter sabulilitoris]